jgi:hypothetical protein
MKNWQLFAIITTIYNAAFQVAAEINPLVIFSLATVFAIFTFYTAHKDV